jgi:hypothetical protein
LKGPPDVAQGADIRRYSLPDTKVPLLDKPVGGTQGSATTNLLPNHAKQKRRGPSATWARCLCRPELMRYTEDGNKKFRCEGKKSQLLVNFLENRLETEVSPAQKRAKPEYIQWLAR